MVDPRRMTPGTTNRTEVFDNIGVKGSEFLRKVKAVAGRNKLAYRWVPERGRGSHGLLSDMYKTARHSQGGLVMFTATYPASFLPEKNGKGFHVRFPDLPEALTGGADLPDTLVEAAECLAEAIAGRIARGDGIPAPSS